MDGAAATTTDGASRDPHGSTTTPRVVGVTSHPVILISSPGAMYGTVLQRQQERRVDAGTGRHTRKQQWQQTFFEKHYDGRNRDLQPSGTSGAARPRELLRWPRGRAQLDHGAGKGPTSLHPIHLLHHPCLDCTIHNRQAPNSWTYMAVTPTAPKATRTRTNPWAEEDLTRTSTRYEARVTYSND